MRTLYVAAGGGGDAVGALLARRALGDADERPALVSTCAWERLRIDPIPGPRARADFTGLGLVDREPFEILPNSDTVPPGRSVLPRLAQSSGARIFLHDLDCGAVGLSGQFEQLASSLDVDKLVVIDVGGDIVARGPEPDLRSPLADSLTLAAALKTGIPTSVVILGPGADAELQEGEVLGLLENVGASTVGCITAGDVRNLEPVLTWHPTEASALVAAGAEGLRGSVAMRRGRIPVPITHRTPEVWVARDPSLESFPIAQALDGTTTLLEAEDVMRTVAANEIDFERTVAQRRAKSNEFMTVPQLVNEMRDIGATHITCRRLSERLGVDRLHQLGEQSTRRPGGLWSAAEIDQLYNCLHRAESPET